ncbi:4-hydroxy-2-oxo-heptane-1,7-dioate aldolase [Halovulum dunhuangense]|uniref:Hydroxypyruvate/pyruvate aldolase n=1 Tax=Halovulum dunhuangense TaxID=1505036 RepID=A0A849L0U5_9RHOB|nr:aldolase/citrate lyase family protein [Halovulum dunhuangense]NNU79865.1 4-hydroxy-2-oxo-heptane-1,7-dioate aldolase [Halovulum dunhuangense]
MNLPENRFKARLRAGIQQIGVWNGIPGPHVAEMLAASGFDWIVVDTEHAPAELSDALPALQAIAAYPESAALVRPAWNDPVLIKRALDLGAQTLMVPMVQSPAEAEAAARAMRYPPRGIRGVAGLHRASRYGMVADYITRAEEQLCLIVQIETPEALDRLEEIAAVDGVDGVFFGPADLSANMGHPGNQFHPEVVAAIEGGIARLSAMGVPAGILTLDEAFARRCMELGTLFTAVGVDFGLLTGAAHAAVTRFGPDRHVP